MSPKSKTEKYLIVLLALFTVGYIVHSMIFLKINREFNCLETIMQGSIGRYHRIQKNPGSLWQELWNGAGPLAKERTIYEVLSLPFYSVFGVSRQAAVYVNYLLLLILLFSVYKIGSAVKDRYLGLLACFQMLMYPAIFGFLRVYFTPLATTAFVAFGIYCLLSSEHFRNTRKVILLLACGILLLKLKLEKGFLYLSVPAVLYLAGSFKINRKDPVSEKIFYRNLGIFCTGYAIFLAILAKASPFASRLNYYLSEVRQAGNSLRITPHTFSLDTISIYAQDLFFIQVGYLGCFFLILGLFFFFKDKLRYKSILASWILTPYMLLSAYYYFSGIHASYYTIEYLPAVALISSCGIYYLLRNSRTALLRTAICLAYLALNLINYVAINYYNRQLPFYQVTRRVSFIGKPYLYSSPPTEEVYFKAAQELIDKILSVKKRVSIVLINHYPRLLTMDNKITLYNLIKNKQVSVYDFSRSLFNLEAPDKIETLSSKMKGADLIISGNRFYPADSSAQLKHYKQFGTVYDFSRQVRFEEEEFKKASGDFTLIKEIKNPEINISFFLNKNTEKKLSSLSPRSH